MLTEESVRSAWILGASRGLGRSLTRYLSTHFPKVESLTLLSRKQELLEQAAQDARSLTNPDGRSINHKINNVQTCAVDLSNSQEVEKLTQKLGSEAPDLVLYVAGGGPYGSFAEKQWKDHHWSLQVGLLSPMRLVHGWLEGRAQNRSGRFVIVGSRVAGLNPDPGAASYAAGKHGLVGFVGSLQSELEINPNKVLLYSPGYMDTEMLPPQAQVRQSGVKLLLPDTAAQALYRWLKKESHWHRVIG
ncbi:MAG: SDR family NAD(P)-dependent oxidoreductase [Oligoflexia bacterium]|nr:SDR family NAD(P)-dependent oxidoreductase [Oligoflexia bacterium]